jgi:hypothetical protein
MTLHDSCDLECEGDACGCDGLRPLREALDTVPAPNGEEPGVALMEFLLHGLRGEER